MPARLAPIASFAVSLWGVSGRSPGFRVAGLSAVKVDGGTPISLSEAAVRVAMSTAANRLTKRVMAPTLERVKQRQSSVADLSPQIKALSERHRDDRQAMRSAVEALYREYGVEPGGCVRAFAQSVALSQTATWIGRRLQDRLLGAVVVVVRR